MLSFVIPEDPNAPDPTGPMELPKDPKDPLPQDEPGIPVKDPTPEPDYIPDDQPAIDPSAQVSRVQYLAGYELVGYEKAITQADSREDKRFLGLNRR